MPATFTTLPFGASEPVRIAMPPCAWIGSESGCTTSPSGAGAVELGEVLRHRLAGDGEAVAVQQARVEQLLHDHRHAADAVEVGHVELAVRLHVGDVRHARADAG